MIGQVHIRTFSFQLPDLMSPIVGASHHAKCTIDTKNSVIMHSSAMKHILGEKKGSY